MSSVCHYLPHGPFHAALKSRVDAYLARANEGRSHASALWFKTAFCFAWLLASYLYCLLFATSWWQVTLGSISIGLAMAGIGFNVQHDGSHGAYSRRAGVNALAACALDAIGGSSYVWAWKHNVFHHSNPNRVGLDADIDIQPFCRLAPEQRRHPWHRLQHLYIWFLYALLAPKWLFDDFRDVARGTVGGRPFPRPGRWQLALLCSGKLFFFTWSLVLPALLHPVLNVLGAWLMASVTVSLVMAVVFQLAHVVDHAAFPRSDAARDTSWAEHQVAATADFAQNNALLTWYIGGLNFQIEHHLFPRVRHTHLPALAAIIRATCEEFGVPYLAYPKAIDALAAHVRWLRLMGAPDGSSRNRQRGVASLRDSP
jgi:linoleoyl-CoA desaturase